MCSGLSEIVNLKPKNFLEIGSRDGNDTHFIKQNFNIEDSNCYIFEAHPKLYKEIQNRYSNYNVYNCAISNKTEPIYFNAATELEDNPGMSSVLNLSNSDFKSEKIQVDGWRIDDISKELKIENIDLTKIDVEGYSLEVLQGFGEMLKKTKCIQIELEHKKVWENQSSYDDVKSFLNENGFTELIYVRIAHDQSDSLWVQNKLILGE
jgi:FkbM family methyltransferase